LDLIGGFSCLYQDSGLGREGVRDAIQEMTEPKFLVMNLKMILEPPQLCKNVHSFPDLCPGCCKTQRAFTPS